MNLDIFNLSVEDLDKPEEKNYQTNEFKPNPGDAKDSVYRALVRPVYWLENPKKNFIPKTSFYFNQDDGNDTNSFTFDSPHSIGEECLAMKTFFDLKREGKKDARAEELAKTIKPKSSFYYLVLVESDIQNPDNVGKLMVYKAPIQVHNIIQNAINVSEADKALGEKPCNIFDPFNGKSLRFAINIVGGNWNYNGTVKLSDSGPVLFEGKPLTVDKKQDFLTLLQEGNLLMEPYKYKKMDDARYRTLLSIISRKTGKQFGDIKPVQEVKVKQELNIEGFDLEPNHPPVNIPKKEPKKESVKQTSSVDDTSFDDILDSLDV